MRTYLLNLNLLDGKVAQFEWGTGEEAILFAMSRTEWHAIGRPSTLTIEVKA